jgi:hypothetical protein
MWTNFNTFNPNQTGVNFFVAFRNKEFQFWSSTFNFFNIKCAYRNPLSLTIKPSDQLFSSNDFPWFKPFIFKVASKDNCFVFFRFYIQNSWLLLSNSFQTFSILFSVLEIPQFRIWRLDSWFSEIEFEINTRVQIFIFKVINLRRKFELINSSFDDLFFSCSFVWFCFHNCFVCLFVDANIHLKCIPQTF